MEQQYLEGEYETEGKGEEAGTEGREANKEEENLKERRGEWRSNRRGIKKEEKQKAMAGKH